MNTTLSAAAKKLRRGSQHFYNNTPVFIERDPCKGQVLVSNELERHPNTLYWVERSEIKYNTKQRSRKSITAARQKKAKQLEKEQYGDFYRSLYDKIPFNCQNCRKPLYAFNSGQKRSVSAHILPKSTFKSVDKDPDNILFLGASFCGSSCDCHTQYDSNLDNRRSMRIYEVTLKRFEILKQKLTKAEIVAAEVYLGIGGAA